MGLTSLNHQNTKQAPIAESPKELIEGGEEVSGKGLEGIGARTRGAVLSVTVSVTKRGPLAQRYLHLGYVWGDGRQGARR